MIAMPGYKDDIGVKPDKPAVSAPNSGKGSMRPRSASSSIAAQDIKKLSHVQQLLRTIHMRFEQKYRDYRMAFRNFDVNFDGTVEFYEFVNGLEHCGIFMPLEDYHAVYNILNYDNADDIDFSKFCLINIDKSNNINDAISQAKNVKEKREQKLAATEKLSLKKFKNIHHLL